MSSWYDDSAATARLPLLYRATACYWRLAALRRPPLRGGSFLLRMASRVSQRLQLKDYAALPVNGATLYVDLLDSRFPNAVQEAAGRTEDGVVISALLQAGDTFIDVGANHGAFSLLASRRVGRVGLVIAFEPQRRLAELLRRSMAANENCRWQVHEIACGAGRFETTLYRPKAGSGAAGVVRAFSGQGAHVADQVCVAPLDETLADVELPGRVVLKIDAEGSELDCLRGARKLIASERPTILIELNPDSARCAGYAIDDVLDELESLGCVEYSTPSCFPTRIPRKQIDTSIQQNLLAFV